MRRGAAIVPIPAGLPADMLSEPAVIRPPMSSTTAPVDAYTRTSALPALTGALNVMSPAEGVSKTTPTPKAPDELIPLADGMAPTPETDPTVKLSPSNRVKLEAA